MQRGFRSNGEVMPDFLTTFDVDDGRAVCPRRTRTVTAPQALFLMNNQFVEEISANYATRLRDFVAKNPKADLITLAFRTALGRPPSASEVAKSRSYLDGITVHPVSSGLVESGVEVYNSERVKGLTWLLLNLDEFIYLR
jgi:hypothetical protein